MSTYLAEALISSSDKISWENDAGIDLGVDLRIDLGVDFVEATCALGALVVSLPMLLYETCLGAEGIILGMVEGCEKGAEDGAEGEESIHASWQGFSTNSWRPGGARWQRGWCCCPVNTPARHAM